MDTNDFSGPVTLTDGEDAPSGAPGAAAPSGALLARGTAVGRYIVADLIGRGGMGEVYKAFDPELNRPVALKLLSTKEAGDPLSSRAANRQSRLLREAQALAQLSHPNVVTIYDVGLHGGTIFMAMEYVQGETLAGVLEAGKHERPKLLAILAAAARGLAAAHRAGIVHRDFKPQNVIIGADGRVRVLDFGLARGVQGDEPGRPAADLAKPHEEPDSSGSLLTSQLTQAGAIVGTPQYMAPEQHLGHQVDHRSDQFSFCVVLFEALYGARPFGGSSLKDLVNRITQEKVERPEKHAVPTWLDRIALRGLTVDPAARFESMEALLAALGNDPAIARAQVRARRFKWVMVLLVVALSGLAAYGIWYGSTRGARLCRGGQEKLAGVWDEPLKGKIREAFEETGRPYAQDTFGRVGKILEAYSKAWLAARRDACEATHLRGEQSEQLLDLRMQCLERRLGEARALTALFAAKPDAGVVDKAVQAALGLEDLRRCADPEALKGGIPLPSDPAARARIETLRTRLDAAKALQKAGRFDEALAIANTLREEVRPGGYPPLEAEILLLQGNLLSDTDQVDAARASLQEAARIAAAGALDEDLVRAWILLVFTDYQQARYDEAVGAGRLVETLALRLGDEELQANAQNAMGLSRFRQGRLDEARALLEQSLELLEKASARDRVRQANTLNNLGLVAQAQRDFVASFAYQNRAIQIWEDTLGGGHPDLALSLNNLGVALYEQKRYPEAEASYQRALAIWERTLDPNHRYMAMVQNNLGEVAIGLQQYRRALTHCEKAVQIATARLGPRHPNLAYPLNCIGTARLSLGQPARAVEALRLALAIKEGSPGDPLELATVRFTLARALWEAREDLPGAVRLARLALEAHRSRSTSEAEPDPELPEIEAWLKARGAR